MNEHEKLVQRINLLEFHQKLLLKLLNDPTLDFYKLIIENGLTEQQVDKFYYMCNELSIKLNVQKAEGYVYFHPLFDELFTSLPANLKIEVVINACLNQKLFEPLFREFKKYIE